MSSWYRNVVARQNPRQQRSQATSRIARRVWLRLSLLLSILLGANPAVDLWSAEWFLEPSLTVRGEVNSNLTLTAFEHKTVYGNWVSPGARFGGATENLEVSGRMAADFVRYYGGQDINITNLYFPIRTAYKLEKEVFSFDGGFTRDNTLMGELRQTGVALSFTQRNAWQASPSWTHYFSEKLSGTAVYQFNSISYDNGRRLGLVDYQLHVGSGGLSYQLTERDKIDLNGLVTRFDAQALKISSFVIGPQVSFSHGFSETLIGVISGGPRRVSSSSDIQGRSLTDSSIVWVFSASLEKQWETWRVKADVGREINPSGFGLLIRTDRIGLNVSKQITDRLTASINGAYLQADGIKTQTSSITFPENHYLVVTPKVTWNLAERWALDVMYNYSQRDLPSASQTALANSFSLMLTYTPVKWSIGR